MGSTLEGRIGKLEARSSTIVGPAAYVSVYDPGLGVRLTLTQAQYRAWRAVHPSGGRLKLITISEDMTDEELERALDKTRTALDGVGGLASYLQKRGGDNDTEKADWQT